jgi:hypothetical protein
LIWERTLQEPDHLIWERKSILAEIQAVDRQIRSSPGGLATGRMVQHALKEPDHLILERTLQEPDHLIWERKSILGEIQAVDRQIRSSPEGLATGRMAQANQIT